MSLQVWLPLNKDLHNQGLSNLHFIPYETSTVIDTNGKLGKCYYNNSHTTGGIISTTPIDLGQKQSMFCWFKFTDLLSDSSLGGGLVTQHRYASNTGMGITIRYVSATTGYLSVNTGNGSSRTYNTYYGTTLLQANTWYHGGFTYDGAEIKIYVNGICEKTQAFTGMSVPADYISLFTWSNGGTTANPNYPHANYKFYGYLNDVRIYDNCLTADEVSEISKGLMVHWLLENNGNKQINTPRELEPFHSVEIEYKAYSLGAPMPVTNSNMLLISFDMDMRVKTGYTTGTEGHGYSIIYNSNNLGPHQIENGAIFHGRPFVSGDRILQHCELIRPIVTRSSPNRFDDVFEFYTDYSSENGYAIRNLKVVKLTPLVGATITTTCNQAGYDDGISGTTDSKGEIHFDLLTALKAWENEYEDIGELVINGTMEPSLISAISPSMNQFYFDAPQTDGHYYIAISRYLYSNPNTILLGIYSNAEVIWDSTKDNVEADCSGMGYHGAKMGVFSYSEDTPRWHASTYFKDYNSTIYCDLPGHIPTEYTMSCWIKSSNKSPAGSYHEPGNVNGQCYEFAIYSDGKFRSGCVIGGTRRVSNIANTNLLDGKWHMITHTYDGSALKSYIDAQLVDTQSYTGALTSMTKVGIGNYLPMPTSYIPNTTYGNTELYESDFRLYMTALSSTDINNLYIGTLHNKEITVNYSFFGNSNALSSSNVIYELSMIPENTKFDVGVHMFEDTAPLQWVTGFKKGTSSTKAITSAISLEYDADTNTITYVRTVTGTVIRMYLTNLKVY